MRRNKKSSISNINFLKMISHIPPNDIAQVLPLLKVHHINLICSVCRNVLFSKHGLKLSKSKIEKIKKLTEPNRKSFLALANKNTNLKRKKKIISQHGKGIGALIGLALPLISSLISGFSK